MFLFCQDDDGDGCLQWTTTTFCGPGQVCDSERGGGCKPAATESCSNACVDGSRDCDGNGWRECKDTNGDGCTEWTEVTNCKGDDVCSGGQCTLPPATCTDACTAGSKDCVGNGWRECKDTNGDGCTEWTNATDCGKGKKCACGALRSASAASRCAVALSRSASAASRLVSALSSDGATKYDFTALITTDWR